MQQQERGAILKHKAMLDLIAEAGMKKPFSLNEYDESVASLQRRVVRGECPFREDGGRCEITTATCYCDDVIDMTGSELPPAVVGRG